DSWFPRRRTRTPRRAFPWPAPVLVGGDRPTWKYPQPTLLLMSSDARVLDWNNAHFAARRQGNRFRYGRDGAAVGIAAEARPIRPAECAGAPSNERRDAVSIPLFRPNRR